jgi:hypothetical protein
MKEIMHSTIMKSDSNYCSALATSEKTENSATVHIQ